MESELSTADPRLDYQLVELLGEGCECFTISEELQYQITLSYADHMVLFIRPSQ